MEPTSKPKIFAINTRKFLLAVCTKMFFFRDVGPLEEVAVYLLYNYSLSI